MQALTTKDLPNLGYHGSYVAGARWLNAPLGTWGQEYYDRAVSCSLTDWLTQSWGTELPTRGGLQLDQVLASTTGDPAAIVAGLVRGIGLPPEVGAHLLGGPPLTEHPGREVVPPSDSLRSAFIEDVKSGLDDIASLTPAGRRRRLVWVLLQLLLVPSLLGLWLWSEWQQGEGLPWFVIVPLVAWVLALPFAGWELSRLVGHHRNLRSAAPNGGSLDLVP